MKNLEKSITGMCIAIVLIVAVQAFLPENYKTPPPTPPAKMVDCRGAAIPLNQPYLGVPIEPWTCKIQCDDGKPRFILYSNGKATQCDTPPACFDSGEDNNIECKPPVLKSIQ